MPQGVNLQIQVVWPEGALDGAKYANMFAAMAGAAEDGAIYLLAGSAAPPLLTDPTATQAAVDEGRVSVEVEPVASMVMPVSRARELVQILTKHIEAVDRAGKGSQS